MATMRSAALIVVASLALTACSGFPIDRSTRGPDAAPSATTSPAASPGTGTSATPTEDPGLTADGGLVLTETSVGALTIDDTAADVAAVTGSDYGPALALFGGECASFAIAETGTYAGVVALAMSEGAEGHIDVYSSPASPDPNTPRAQTAKGIGLGSTEQDVIDAYGGAVVYKPSYDHPENTALIVENGGEGMRFTVNLDHVVIAWAVGRVTQLENSTGCA